MKILLLGATGRTGRWILEEAIGRGHIVHALVRDPAKLKITNGRLILFEGTPTDSVALEKAMQQYGYTYKPFWYFPSVGEYTSLLEEYGFRINQAYYFDRATELANPENGIIEWFEMFGDHFFEGISDEDRDAILQHAQESLRATHQRNGKWYADYVRLRIAAVKN